MSWFKADQTLPKHPKTSKLRKILKISRREAVGLLFDLFAWGLDTADKNGRLIGADAEAIGMALDCTERNTEKTVNALREAGFLEFDGEVWSIHDWYDYSGKMSERKEKDRTRKRGNSAGVPQEFHRTSAGNPPLDKIRLDKTRLESPSIEGDNRGAPAREAVREYAAEVSAPPGEADAFWSYWQARGWRPGGEDVSDWKALFDSWLLRGRSYSSSGNQPQTPTTGRKPNTARENAAWLRDFLANDDETDD